MRKAKLAMREQHARRLRTEVYLARLQEEARRGVKEEIRWLDRAQVELDRLQAALDRNAARDAPAKPHPRPRSRQSCHRLGGRRPSSAVLSGLHQGRPSRRARVVSVPRVGGLHHRYAWRRRPSIPSPRRGLGVSTPAVGTKGAPGGASEAELEAAAGPDHRVVAGVVARARVQCDSFPGLQSMRDRQAPRVLAPVVAPTEVDHGLAGSRGRHRHQRDRRRDARAKVVPDRPDAVMDTRYTRIELLDIDGVGCVDAARDVRHPALR